MDPSTPHRLFFESHRLSSQKPPHLLLSALPKSEVEYMLAPNKERYLHKNGRFDVYIGKLGRSQHQMDIMASNDIHSNNEQCQGQEFDFISAIAASSSPSTASQPSQPRTPPIYYYNDRKPDGCVVSALPVAVYVEDDVPATVDSNKQHNPYASADIDSSSRLTASTTTTMTTMTATSTSVTATTTKRQKKTKSGRITKKGRRISSNSTLPCPVCSQTYSRKDNLRAHMRIHSGERPYKCMQCTSAFRWLGALRKHVANEHSNKDLEKRDENRSALDDSAKLKSDKSSSSASLNITSSLPHQVHFPTTLPQQQQTAQLEMHPVTEVCLLPGSFPTTSQDMCSTNLNMPNISDMNDDDANYVIYNKNSTINSKIYNNCSVLTTNNLKETPQNRPEEDCMLDVLWTLPEPWTLPEQTVSTFLELTPNFLSVAPKH